MAKKKKQEEKKPKRRHYKQQKVKPIRRHHTAKKSAGNELMNLAVLVGTAIALGVVSRQFPKVDPKIIGGVTAAAGVFGAAKFHKPLQQSVAKGMAVFGAMTLVKQFSPSTPTIAGENYVAGYDQNLLGENYVAGEEFSGENYVAGEEFSGEEFSGEEFSGKWPV